MPTLFYDGQTLTCAVGERVRDVLLQHGLTPHNATARYLNCHGFGTCGTCAVAIEGPVTPKTARERWRLSFPPHEASSGLRLACQSRVLGDLVVTKHDGFWGQHVDPEAEPDAP